MYLRVNYKVIDLFLEESPYKKIRKIKWIFDRKIYDQKFKKN